MAQAFKNLKWVRERQKAYADKKRRELELQVDDEVFLFTRNLLVQLAIGSGGKLGPLYCGPFIVLEKLASAYRLDLPLHMRVHPVFHVSQLKLCKKPKDTMRTYKKPNPVITAAREEEFEVQEIINDKKRRRGRKQKLNI